MPVQPGPFTVRVDVYDTVVRIWRDVGKMYAFAKRAGAPATFLEEFDSPCEGRGYRFQNSDGASCYGLYLRDTLPDPGTVAHECFHVARYILDDRGVVEENDSQEATAYLLGYLVTSIYTRLGREAS